jgi:predicted DCC family thiol-disulfide oxidoreductase YuxK
MSPTHLPNTLTLIFDGSCGFCTRSARLVQTLDRARRVTVAPFQKPGVPERVGLIVAECEWAAWVVAPDGQRAAGAAAVNLALAVALGNRLLLRLYQLPLLHQLEDWLYAWVAANRHRLPGDTPYCDQHPAECGQPELAPA